MLSGFGRHFPVSDLFWCTVLAERRNISYLSQISCILNSIHPLDGAVVGGFTLHLHRFFWFFETQQKQMGPINRTRVFIEMLLVTPNWPPVPFWIPKNLKHKNNPKNIWIFFFFQKTPVVTSGSLFIWSAEAAGRVSFSLSTCTHPAGVPIRQSMSWKIVERDARASAARAA